MTMNLRRIDSGTAVSDTLCSSVIKAGEIDSVAAARDVLHRARLEAERIVRAAVARGDAAAEECVRQRVEEVSRRQLELEARQWQTASNYAALVKQEWERALAQLEMAAVDLLCRALVRLVEELPAQERARACVKQLLAEVDLPDTGVLLVAADDHASITALGAGVPWPVQRHADVVSGTVRLVCEHGRWDTDMATSLALVADALRAPVGASVPPSEDLGEGVRNDD